MTPSATCISLPHSCVTSELPDQIAVQDEGEVTAREEAQFFDVLAKLRSGDREGLAQHQAPGTDSMGLK